MKLEVIKKRKLYFWISLAFILFSIAIFFWVKLNYWIDMTWGTSAEYSYTWRLDLNTIRKNLDQASKTITYKNREVINGIDSYKITGQDKITIITWYDPSIPAKDLDKIKANFRAKTLEILKQTNPSFTESSYTNIGKSFWDYIKNTAILTLILAIIWIALYVMWAFSAVASWISTFSFSIITILTLFHDVIIATWLYILTSLFFREFKIDTYFVTALLTILGYSINDTIVVFDRIRSNLKKFAGKKDYTLEKIIDMSVSETLRRSIFTSFTVILVLIALLIWGPLSIQWFILAMIYGTVVWTYSSIFIASPLLYEFNKHKKLEKYKEKKYNPEDKIVV